MARLLVVNSATPIGGLALICDGVAQGEVSFPPEGTHSDHLLPGIGELLAGAGLPLEQLDGFAVVAGPGSFTGLRVGLATVKGLAMALGRPVLALSSLEVQAANAGAEERPVCALLDARKQEVYAGLFRQPDGRPRALGEEAALSPATLLEGLPAEVVLIGSGALLYAEQLVGGGRVLAAEGQHQLKLSAAAPLIHARWQLGEARAERLLEPRYLRLSEAENQRLARLATAEAVGDMGG